MNFYHFASPANFYPLAGRLIPVFAVLAAVLAAIGLTIGLLIAPTDFQQGDAYRIIFVHVPASWMSMLIYCVMAFWAAIGLGFRVRLAHWLAASLAPTGAIMALLSLFTGAVWGKPTWGTWWVWDARLTSELILFFLYMGFIALRSAIENPQRAERAAALLALVGVVNVPIIYFSVKWWNTLHQGASVSVNKAPSMAAIMLWGMLIMSLAFWCYSIAVALWRTRRMVVQMEGHTQWVKDLRSARISI